jgi:ankyrin repeat protein
MYPRISQEVSFYEQRVQALHNACTAGEFTKVRDMLIKHPEDYYVVNWCRNNCTVLQSAILGGSLQLIQYFKPYPDELQYGDAEGNTAVHYAAKSAAPDRTELLRYFQFIIEPSYLKEIQNVVPSKSGQKYATVRPLQSKIQVPTLPKHMLEAKAGAGRGTDRRVLLGRVCEVSTTLFTR